ncbi:MAG: GNAT family N-acetyltransferase [Actinomycetota bacterium]|nr:GNAT family N-acetyltransferase [Actinomycetota bacterium]
MTTEHAAANKPAAIDDTSWHPAAAATIVGQMQRDVLAACVVDDPAAATTPSGRAPISAYAIAAVRAYLPGPGLPTGLNGTMSSVYVEERHRGGGLARAVVTAGLGWLDERGAEIVDLQATGRHRAVPVVGIRRAAVTVVAPGPAG